MYNDIKKHIEHLNQKRDYLDADFDTGIATGGSIPLLEFYVKTMPSVLNAERCSIFIYDPQSKTTWLKCGTGLQERDIEVTGEYESVVGKVISTGQYKIVSDLEKKNGIHKQTDQTTGFVTRDILCIPIKSLDGTKVVGAVQLLNKKDGTQFNDKDRGILEEMAHYLELTIENIFFNQEAAGALNDLYSLITKITVVFITTIIFLIIFISILTIILE